MKFPNCEAYAATCLGEHAVAGRIGATAYAPPIIRQTDLPCPMCRAPMQLLVNAQQLRVARVVRSCDAGEVCNGVAETLPPDLDVYGCDECGVNFYAPK